MPKLYHAVFKYGFSRLDAEEAHHLAGAAIRLAGKLSPAREAIRATFGRSGHREIELFGKKINGPLGLAAGFDKDATMAAGLGALGFSFIEVGTFTAKAQPGNDKPRLRRVIDRRALVNRMGFNNQGAEEAGRRMRALRRTKHGRQMLLGANIGKTKLTPAASAVADYRASARAVAPYADYLVVNVSSPNTPGLRDLQHTESLRPILVAVRDAAIASAARQVPILVKIAPDLSNEDIDGVAHLVKEMGLAGVVAANTTIDHPYGGGGMSGKPLLERGLEVVARARAVLGPEAVIIGVGGITTAADVEQYLAAGANVVQAYTAFIYEGPAWPGRINRRVKLA